ncbi:MAG: ATP synthase F1 subunit delta [Armatimonadota bacterium]|nr:ATP synthase F1 subunit delta [Armatimonadota bacterium]
MVDLRVARRYARALFEVAIKRGQLQQTSEELANLRLLMRASEELRRFFYSPLIPRDYKSLRLRQVLKDRILPFVMRLIELLIEKRRENLFEAICDEFERLKESYLQVERAVITTAVPLDETQQAALVQALERRTGKKILPIFKVDPSLLGGVRVRIGDQQIDGSLRGALDRLRESITLEIERRVARSTTAR